jgi:spore germination protein YaaH
MIQLVFFLLLLLVVPGCFSTKPPVRRKGDLYVAAWYAAYTREKGWNSFEENYWLFNEINPVWYNLNPEYFVHGQAPILHTYNEEQYKSAITGLAREHGIKLVPSIQNWGEDNFDDQVIVEIIQDDAKRAKHVQEIVDLVVANGYDGIDIDYEALRKEARNDFSAFIAELGEALHAVDKLLSVAVYAKTHEAGWDGAGAQDWAELAKHADALKVMGYDYHWCTQHPGPLTPLDWLEDVLAYADEVARRAPSLKGKLIIGLPLYGLDWEAWSTSDDGPAATETMYVRARNLLNTYKSEVKRDNVKHYPCNCHFSTNVEPYFLYEKDGKKHIVYYQDAAATRARLELIDKYRHLVKGITFWRLGEEDPEIWEAVAKYSLSITGEM